MSSEKIREVEKWAENVSKNVENIGRKCEKRM